MTSDDLVERSRKLAADALDFDGETMKEWDRIRAECSKRDGSDLPRLMFEALIESFAELLIDTAAEIERLRNQLAAADEACQRLCGKHGFSTGHGDTIADMVNEIGAQIPDDKRASEDGWRPIETAPRDGTAIMLGFWYQGRFSQYQAFYGRHGWMEDSRSYHCKQFQKWFELWHPLPEPPTPSREPRPAGGGEDGQGK